MSDQVEQRIVWPSPAGKLAGVDGNNKYDLHDLQGPLSPAGKLAGVDGNKWVEDTETDTLSRPPGNWRAWIETGRQQRRQGARGSPAGKLAGVDGNRLPLLVVVAV